jgi:hypothetical protein
MHSLLFKKPPVFNKNALAEQQFSSSAAGRVIGIFALGKNKNAAAYKDVLR